MLNLAVSKETARLLKVNKKVAMHFYHINFYDSRFKQPLFPSIICTYKAL
jgi:hypothetical protein